MSINIRKLKECLELKLKAISVKHETMRLTHLKVSDTALEHESRQRKLDSLALIKESLNDAIFSCEEYINEL